ncbi:MAG: hypothetical protein G01um101420_594 [Parcubacteria group bacterium Gr01-1014_20]|nr:MAG: hypothetical protein G01um101420_594 [Parcubacteria group bacterium Gr01-1014_20]
MELVAIFLGILPGFAWLFFYLREDLHPEPKNLIALTFIFGVTSAIFALGIQVVLSHAFEGFGIKKYSLIAILFLALVEELAKFGGAFFAVHKNEAFDEPVDAMIYMVVASLGFATLENVGALGGFVSGYSGSAAVSEIISVSSMRFVGATLLHTLSSGIVGYYWAKSIRDFGSRGNLILGIILATMLHTLFNYLIITSESLSYSILLVIIVGFIILNDFEKLKEKAI